MNSTSNPITLESITQRKVELQKEIRAQQQVMTNTARSLFAPFVATASKGSALMQTFNSGMAIFDGVMLGIKLMRKFRRLFH